MRFKNNFRVTLLSKCNGFSVLGGNRKEENFMTILINHFSLKPVCEL